MREDHRQRPARTPSVEDLYRSKLMPIGFLLGVLSPLLLSLWFLWLVHHDELRSREGRASDGAVRVGAEASPISATPPAPRAGGEVRTLAAAEAAKGPASAVAESAAPMKIAILVLDEGPVAERTKRLMSAALTARGWSVTHAELGAGEALDAVLRRHADGSAWLALLRVEHGPKAGEASVLIELLRMPGGERLNRRWFLPLRELTSVGEDALRASFDRTAESITHDLRVQAEKP